MSTMTAAALGAALSGCGSVPPDASPAPPPPPSVPATGDPETAKAAILAAFSGYNTAAVIVAGRPYPVRPGENRERLLGQYAGEPLLSLELGANARNRSIGAVYRGRRTWTGRVTSIQWDTTPPSADLVLCMDTSGWYPVEVKTGKSARGPGVWGRERALSRAERSADGRWYIVALDSQAGSSC